MKSEGNRGDKMTKKVAYEVDIFFLSVLAILAVTVLLTSSLSSTYAQTITGKVVATRAEFD